MNNFMFLKPNQAPHFHFIIRKPPPDPSDFRLIMKKSLYKRFYTKTPNSATFDVENGHHSPFSCHSKFRLAIPQSLIFPLTIPQLSLPPTISNTTSASPRSFLNKSHHIAPSPLTTTRTVRSKILISSPTLHFFIYSVSSRTTSSKSVILLLPLTCHIPVTPGLIASRARW